jgi:hypothetical protein
VDIRNTLSFHFSISAHKKLADRGPAQCPETLVSLHSHTVTRRTQPSQQPRRSLMSHLSALSVSPPPSATGHRHSASKTLARSSGSSHCHVPRCWSLPVAAPLVHRHSASNRQTGCPGPSQGCAGWLPWSLPATAVPPAPCPPSKAARQRPAWQRR